MTFLKCAVWFISLLAGGFLLLLRLAYTIEGLPGQFAVVHLLSFLLILTAWCIGFSTFSSKFPGSVVVALLLITAAVLAVCVSGISVEEEVMTLAIIAATISINTWAWKSLRGT